MSYRRTSGLHNTSPNGDGSVTTNIAAMSGIITAAAVGLNFWAQNRGTGQQRTSSRTRHSSRGGLPSFVQEQILIPDMTDSKLKKTGLLTNDMTNTSVSTDGIGNDAESQKDQRGQSVAPELTDFNAPVSPQRLKDLSCLCQSEMYSCIDQQAWQKLIALSSMMMVLEDLIAMTGEMDVAVTSGNWESVQRLVGMMKTRKEELSKHQKSIAKMVEEENGKLDLDESEDETNSIAPNGIIQSVKHKVLSKFGSSKTTVDTRSSKRCLRSTTSSAGRMKRAKLKTERQDLEDKVGDTLPTTSALKMTSTTPKDFKKDSKGRRLCQVDQCTKIADGKRSNFMCRHHFSLSKRTEESGEDSLRRGEEAEADVLDEDFLTNNDSQNSSLTWSTVSSEVEFCFYCDKPADEETLLRCTNPKCGLYWHLKKCQNTLLRESGYPEITQVSAETFRCSECKAKEGILSTESTETDEDYDPHEIKEESKKTAEDNE